MRKFKYIILAILLISLSISSFPHILNGISSTTSGDLMFLETYTYAEFTSKLDPVDPFFKMINTSEAVKTSSKLGFCPDLKEEEAWSYIHSPAFQEKLPEDLSFAWGPQEDDGGKYIYALKKLDTQYSGPDKSSIKEIGISKGTLLISFTEEGSEKWTSLTRNSVGNCIAIVIDGVVYSAPVVREVIENGKCAISGDFSEGELEALKSVLE